MRLCWVARTIALCLPFLALVAAGCGGDATDGGTSDSTASATDTETSSDGDATDGGTSGATESETHTQTSSAGDGIPPEILEFYVTENPTSVLSGTASIGTDTPTTVEVEVSASGVLPWSIPVASPEGTMHDLPVLGLRAETEYTFTATATQPDGDWAQESLRYTTAPLPDDFPPLVVGVTNPSASSPGVTVFNVHNRSGGAVVKYSLALGVDAEGYVVWYYRSPRGPMGEIQRLPDGDFLFNWRLDGIARVDVMGNEVWAYSIEDLGIDSIHHDVLDLEDGNILVLSSELRSISGYNGGADTFDVVGDVVVELQENGTVVATHTAFDYFDPLRIIPHFFDHDFWNHRYGDEAPGGTKDWTHTNAIVVDPDDGHYVVSMRHQNWIAKIDPDVPGAVDWILGEDGTLTMQGDGEWAYGQHAPEFQDDGTLFVYDNGVARPGHTGEDYFTRVVQYAIDDQASTVEQIWEYRNDARYFAPSVGDVDRMPNGNVLICDGGIVLDPTKLEIDPSNIKAARMTEITYETTPQKVWEIELIDTATPTNWTVFRADRWESLYPPQP